MLLYKPTNQLFQNRLEAKKKLGHSKYNKIMKNSPDELIYINDDHSFATYEYIRSNANEHNRETDKEKQTQ